MDRIEHLEKQLDSFDATQRRDALEDIATMYQSLSRTGELVNMHFHSFFSYNADGYSPSHIVWESRMRGFYAAGLCDFDVLDG